VSQLRTLMEERNLSLQEAQKLNTELLAGPQQDGDDEFAGWPEVAARFLAGQQGRRSSTLRDLNTRVERTLRALKSLNPDPVGAARKLAPRSISCLH
jgi:hypothetical protein